RRAENFVEYFDGGGYSLRASLTPIVSVSSIRESETWDFDTSGEYTELTDGTDYVLAPGRDPGHRISAPGGSGVIRRRVGRWMGNERSRPGQVRVTYTGGY